MRYRNRDVTTSPSFRRPTPFDAPIEAVRLLHSQGYILLPAKPTKLDLVRAVEKERRRAVIEGHTRLRDSAILRRLQARDRRFACRDHKSLKVALARAKRSLPSDHRPCATATTGDVRTSSPQRAAQELLRSLGIRVLPPKRQRGRPPIWTEELKVALLGAILLQSEQTPHFTDSAILRLLNARGFFKHWSHGALENRASQAWAWFWSDAGTEWFDQYAPTPATAAGLDAPCCWPSNVDVAAQAPAASAHPPRAAGFATNADPVLTHCLFSAIFPWQNHQIC